MRRPSAAILFTAAAVAIAAAASAMFTSPGEEELTPPEPGLYFPTSVGGRWSYEMNGEPQGTPYTVERVEGGGNGTFLVTEQFQLGQLGPATWTYSVSPTELSVVAVAGRRNEPPEVLLRLDVAIGESWETTTVTGRPATRTMRGVESVEVPAGGFRAVRVDWTWVNKTGETVRGSDWFALGTGRIKTVYMATERLAERIPVLSSLEKAHY